MTEQWNPEMLKSLGRLDLIAAEVVDGVFQGAHRGVRRGFSSEFFDYKSYLDGDDARWIDWRLYAKSGKLFSKQFEAETSRECLLLLDMSPSMAWRWRETVSKREYGMALAASLATLLLRQRDLVGFLGFGDGASRHLPPKSSARQLQAIFALMAASPPPGQSKSLQETAVELYDMRHHRGLNILISDLEIPEDELRGALRLLRARGDELIVVHLLDQAEIDLPFGDVTHLVDSETGEVIQADSLLAKQRRTALVDNFRRLVKTICQENQVTFAPVDTSVSYVEAITSLAEQRRQNAGI